MHVLTTRGGELVALVGPICDNPDCTGCRGWAALDSTRLVEYAVVADRDDIIIIDLELAATAFLEHTGCTKVDPERCAQLAADMAFGAAEIAAGYPIGTRLAAAYSSADDRWSFTPQ